MSKRQSFFYGQFIKEHAETSEEYTSKWGHSWGRTVYDRTVATGVPIDLERLVGVLAKDYNAGWIALELKANGGKSVSYGIINTWTRAIFHSNGRVVFEGTSDEDYEDAVKFVIRVLNKSREAGEIEKLAKEVGEKLTC